MKRILYISICLFCLTSLSAQISVQLHRDLGSVLYPNDLEGRAKTTSTIQMQKPDKWGSTFFLVDLEYTRKGIGSTFFKLSRKVSFWDAPIHIQFDYKGGHSSHNAFKNNYLAGGSYTFRGKDFSKFISFSLLYKYIQKHHDPHNFQISCVWKMDFLKRLCSFSGFADWGRDKGRFGDFTALVKPQLWLNLNQIKGIDKDFNLSVGSVSEITYNQGNMEGFYVVPSLSIKWAFN